MQPYSKRIPTALFFCCLLALILGVRVAEAKGPTCRIRVNKRAKRGKRIKPPIRLTILNQSDPVLNFGEKRGSKSDYIVLEASRRLPRSVRAGQFEMNSLVPMKRIGTDNLETTRLKPLKRSRTAIFDNRERIRFYLCVDGKGGNPGTYTGQVSLSGPPGLAAVTISQTAQLKAELGYFIIALVISLLPAAIVLIYRVRNGWHDKSKSQKITEGLVIGFSLIVAGAAMYGVYDKSPAWGADWAVSVAALIGTSFAAVGLGSGIPKGAKKLTELLDG